MVGDLEWVLRPLLFALLGYESENTIFRAAGVGLNGRGEPAIRPADGAVWTPEDGYVSNLFAIGACAVVPRQPSAGTIPGIFGQAPNTSLTIGIRSGLW